MAFCIDELKEKYDDRTFFTSDRECIEYLLAVNLQPLEEYALLVTGKDVWVFTPHELEGLQAVQVLYEGYSNRRYQDKQYNILRKLNEFTLPAAMDAAFEKLNYSDYFSNRGIKVNDISHEISKAAVIKNEEQVGRIKECVAVNEKAFSALIGKNIDSETELSLFFYVKEAVMKQTSAANHIIYDFLSGARTGEVSGFPTNYKLRAGDTLIADLLPRHKGVYADMTRTYFAGCPDKRQKAAYEIVTEALQNAEKILKPGITAKAVYESVYNIFKKYRVEQNFPHHAGHGLGMGYYEAPFFLSDEEEILQESMVVAIEPGLYFKDHFGIRIENNYLITANGAERLGSLPTNIEKFIL